MAKQLKLTAEGYIEQLEQAKKVNAVTEDASSYALKKAYNDLKEKYKLLKVKLSKREKEESKKENLMDSLQFEACYYCFNIKLRK